MASFVLTNAFCLLNAVDLSDHVRSVKVNYKADTPENTPMSQTTKNRLPGLKDWEMDVEVNQDFALAKVDATLFPLVGAAAFPIEAPPHAGARSATSPAYTPNCLLADHPPLGNEDGEV